jgi:type VI secretion system protein ImpA
MNSIVPPSSLRPSAVDASEWLLPLTDQAPCGVSLEYDAEFAMLLSRMTPRGDAQYGSFMGTPEASDWAEVERDCRRLLLRARDINVIVWLARARTRLSQAFGLAQVLASLAEVLNAWPDAIHPQMVIEGEVDPAVRANALAALADPEGLMSDVREVVVASSTAMRLTVRDVERAFAVPQPADAPSVESVIQQLAALHLAAASDDTAPVRLLAQAARELRAIEVWGREHLGNEAPSLEALLRVLDFFAHPEHVPTKTISPEPQATQEAIRGSFAVFPSSLPGIETIRPSMCGQAAARQDVLSSIREARKWFEEHEPSSPVAVLLMQAERMVGKRFSQVADSIPLDLLLKWEQADERGNP